MTIRSLTLADFDAVNTIFMQMQNLHIKYRPDLYRKIENRLRIKPGTMKPRLKTVIKLCSAPKRTEKS